MWGPDLSDPNYFDNFFNSGLDRRNASSTYLYILLKTKMVIYNEIANLFLAIVNNISYNKIEVEKIILKNFKKRRIF